MCLCLEQLWKRNGDETQRVGTVILVYTLPAIHFETPELPFK